MALTRFERLHSIGAFSTLLNFVVAANSFAADTEIFNASMIPEGFENAIYNVPLAVRLETNEQFSADGVITLSKDGFVKLLSVESASYNSTRLNKNIQKILETGVYLDDCDASCGIINKIVFDPNTSLLAIFTNEVSLSNGNSSSYIIPEHGSTGLVLQNNFNGNLSDATNIYSYIGSASTNIGSWTGYSHFNSSKSSDTESIYMLSDLYGQTNVGDNQLKIGYFTPDYTLSGGIYAVVPNRKSLSLYGVSFGSTEGLGEYSGNASLIPLVVTANQAGYVEVYKDGQLIGSFPVKAGIQSIPTEGFPDGIYSVSLKIYENGKVVSTANGEINKAINFQGSALKYKFFGGKKSYIGHPSSDFNDSFIGGGSVSYLFHPRMNVGVSFLNDDDETSGAISSTVDFSNTVRLYNNYYQSNSGRHGGDVQIMYRGKQLYASLSTSYSKDEFSDHEYNSSFNEQPELLNPTNTRYSMERLTSTISLNGNIGRNQIYSAFNYDHKTHDKKFSLGTNYYADDYLPAGSYLSASINNAIYNDRRTWGATLNVNIPISIGTQGSSSAAIGFASQKDSNGNVDTALTASFDKNYDDGTIKYLAANTSISEKSANATLSTSFSTSLSQGSGYLAIDHADDHTSKSLGVNFNNSLVLGAGAATLTNSGSSNTGVIVNVVSSIDDDADLIARVDGVGVIHLTDGANFIPVQPYKQSTISYDLINGGESGGAKFSPSSENINLFPGGVAVKTVDVMRTVTVVGRVVDKKNNVLSHGVEVKNHAGVAFPESDGIFVLEMSIEHPTISIVKDGHQLCEINYAGELDKNNLLLLDAGDVSCPVKS